MRKMGWELGHQGADSEGTDGYSNHTDALKDATEQGLCYQGDDAIVIEGRCTEGGKD